MRLQGGASAYHNAKLSFGLSLLPFLSVLSLIKMLTSPFSFVNRTIADWNRLPERTIGISPVKTHIFRKRVREVKQ
jgi:hypothetical protein